MFVDGPFFSKKWKYGQSCQSLHCTDRNLYCIIPDNIILSDDIVLSDNNDIDNIYLLWFIIFIIFLFFVVFTAV